MTAPGREALVAELLERLDALRCHQRAQMLARGCPRGVSMSQLHILLAIHDRRVTTLRELGELLDIAPPSVTAIIDRMEQNGLVYRRRDGEDRRHVGLGITAAGRAVVDEMAGLRCETLSKISAGLTDAELHGLIVGIAGVLRMLEGSSPSLAPPCAETG